MRGAEGFQELSAKAVILGCGGFEANPEWRARYLGRPWDSAKVRGTRYNTGDGLRMAMELGALPHGRRRQRLRNRRSRSHLLGS